MSPNPIMLYPPHGSNILGILSNMGTPSSPVLSPRATYMNHMNCVLSINPSDISGY